MMNWIRALPVLPKSAIVDVEADSIPVALEKAIDKVADEHGWCIYLIRDSRIQLVG